MKFDHLGLIESLERYSSVKGTNQERAHHLARIFSDPPSILGRGNESGSNLLKELCAPLRFLVLNIPYSITNSTSRIFLAVLRQDCLVPPDRVHPKATKESADDSSVLIFGRDIPASSKRGLIERWNREWVYYSHLTQLLQGQRVYTWNQFLLHGCDFTSALGLNWGPRETPGYFSLTPGLAKELGLPDPTTSNKGGWHRKLAHLPDHPKEARGIMAKELAPRWHTLAPGMSRPELEQSVSHGIYHLVRSYAIWGGQAFLSLPITVAATPETKATAVLSLCSDVPLGPDEVFTWKAIGMASLSSLGAAEVADHQSRLQRSRALEGIGHTLKWATEATGWQPVHEDLCHLSKELPNDEINTIVERAASSLSLFSLVQGLGNLVRLTGAISRRRYQKLATWHDTRLHEEWLSGRAAEIGRSYLETVFALGRMVAFGTGWPRVEVELLEGDDVVERRQWYAGSESAQGPQAFKPYSLQVPPFKPGSDAIFVLAVGLGEPLANAARHLLESGESDRQSLKIRILPEVPQRVRILIGNPTSTPPEGIPAGLRDTGRLLQLTSFAYYDEPFIEGDGGDWWVPLVITPLEISKLVKP